MQIFDAHCNSNQIIHNRSSFGIANAGMQKVMKTRTKASAELRSFLSSSVAEVGGEERKADKTSSLLYFYSSCSSSKTVSMGLEGMTAPALCCCVAAICLVRLSYLFARAARTDARTVFGLT